MKVFEHRPAVEGTRPLGTPAILLCVLSLVLLTGCQSGRFSPVPGQVSSQIPERTSDQTEARDYREEFGIEVVAIRTTAAGTMLDFRFRVLDKEKAMPFFLKEIKPHLIDEKSGAVLEVPVPAKGGPMRPTSRNPREGVTYFMLFANPGGFVQKGNPVTIALDDLRVENLIVE